MYCKGYFFTGFSKRDYSYLEFVFPFKGSEELMHINVNMKYNVKQMLLYVISLRDTAGENKTFCKLYVMFFLNVKMHSILKHSIIFIKHDINEHRYSQNIVLNLKKQAPLHLCVWTTELWVTFDVNCFGKRIGLFFMKSINVLPKSADIFDFKKKHWSI